MTVKLNMTVMQRLQLHSTSMRWRSTINCH